MAEGFAVVSIVSSIVQLVDFTSRVLGRLNEFHSSTSDIPKSLVHLKAELPVLVHILQQIESAINNGLFQEECAAALLPAIQGCKGSIQEIELILVKTLPKQSDGWAKKTFKSLDSVLKDGKIENTTKILRGYIQTLTFYFAASSSTLQPLTDAKLTKIRKWLSAPDPSVNFQKALNLRHADTGLWLVESDLYRRWKAEASFVWLHGIPGCGKTVLTSNLLEDLLKYAANDPGKAVAYFYFDFNDRQKQDPELMVRSLVSQLSQQCIKISPSLDALFVSCENGERQPYINALLKVLQQLIEEFPRTYIIIDALDECASRKELMRIIKEMFIWQLQGLQVLLTSRREGDIESTLGRILNDKSILCIQTEAVDHDIQSYVRQRLSDDESLRKWQADATIRQRVESSLMQGAHGMFRWATCQLDILGECRNRKQLLQALADLPPNLDETYNRILGAIKKSDIQYAIRILRWLAFSSRPLRLTEVAEIAAIDADRYPAFDRDEVLEDPLEVLSICSSLIAITLNKPKFPRAYNASSEPVVLLAHYSVKEYLVSERIYDSKASVYAMESVLSHQLIAKCCLQYLLQFNSIDNLTEANLKEFVLATYSAQHWVTHAKANAEQDAETAALIIKLLNASTGAYLTWVHLHNPDTRWSTRADFGRTPSTIPSPLYYASQAGLAGIVRRLILETSADANAQGGRYGNALQAASYHGHIEIAQFLVEKGADVNARGGEYGNALQAASSRGRLDIVQFLIEKGVDVNAQGGEYDNALQAASIRGRLDIIRFLVEKGADINVQGREHGNALQAALSRGRLDIMQFLVEKGANVNAQGGKYGNALRAASSRGRLDIVQFLVKNGADVNAQDREYGSALQVASSRGHLDVMQFLVEKGANVNLQGGKYGNALQAASIRGELDILQYLVGKGADVNAQGGEYGNALQAASLGGELDILQFLVEKDADVNAQGGRYGSVIQAASLEGELDIVQFLVEKGANVNAQGGQYGNTLQAASLRGKLDIVQFLVKEGANVNAQGGQYGNALQAGSLGGELDMVQFLVEKGADVNAQGGQYGNALQMASLQGELDILQYLIEKGADVNAQGGVYGNALQAASFGGELDVVRLLVENGADVNARGGEYGNTLQAASYQGHLDIVQFLVEKGADVNAQGGEYGSALQAASYLGYFNSHLDVMQFLIEKGADVNAQGGEYGNALQAASYQGHLNIVQFLVKKGADVNAQGGRYGNAYQAALSEGRLDIMQYLLENGAVKEFDMA